MSEIRVDTISEKTSANGVAVDGVTLKDGGIAATLASTITTADNTDTLSLISTDADADEGPNLRLYRNSASPADNDKLGSIAFVGEDSAGNENEYARIDVRTGDVTDGTEDGRFVIFNQYSGTLRNMLNATGTETIFNDDSQNVDFRVESDGNANMIFVDGGNNHVNIGTATDLGGVLNVAGDMNVTGSPFTLTNTTNNNNIDIKTTSSSSVVHAVKIHSGGLFEAKQGAIFNEDSNNVDFRVETNNNANAFLIDGGNDTIALNDTAPDTTEGGICFNQLGADSNIISFKSSDVAHGITGSNETDTYLTMGKASATQGGFVLKSYAEGDDGFLAESFCGTINTTKGTGGNACFMFKGRAADNGSGFQNPTSTAANANLFAIANGNLRVFIFDGEGDLHADGALNATAYDTYEDAHLVRAMDLSHGQNLKGLVNSKFDEYINYNHETLAEAGLVGREEDGTPNHFINVTGMQRLHNGAIWQQYEKTEKLANAFYKLATKTIGKAEADKLLTEEEIQLLN